MNKATLFIASDGSDVRMAIAVVCIVAVGLVIVVAHLAHAEKSKRLVRRK